MNTSSAQIASQIDHSGFIGQYLVTMRPYLMFVSGITGIVGMSIIEHIPMTKALLIGIASFLSYGFGQALTDCFQIDTDSISSPYRPLTQGTISRRAVMTVSIVGLCSCVVILSWHTPTNLVPGLAAGIGLATYTSLKRRWWGGPFYNAAIVVVLCLMAFRAARTTTGGNIPIAGVYVFATVFFAYANFVLTGYFKDVAADRATGYYTLPVVFGNAVAARVSDIFMVLGMGATGLFINNRHTVHTLHPVDCISLMLIIAGGVTAIVGQIRLHLIVRDTEAHRAITLVVHSYILVLAGMAGLNQVRWIPALLAFYAAFVITMRSRPEKSQI